MLLINRLMPLIYRLIAINSTDYWRAGRAHPPPPRASHLSEGVPAPPLRPKIVGLPASRSVDSLIEFRLNYTYVTLTWIRSSVRCGSLGRELSLGILCLGTFVWRRSFEFFAWERSLGINEGIPFEIFRFGTFASDRSLRNVRFG